MGIWGKRHEQWLKQEHRALYHNLMLTRKLHSHLAEVDVRAEQMFFSTIDKMALREGVTEQLKAINQMAWVQQMNNIRARAEEIIYAEVICSL